MTSPAAGTSEGRLELLEARVLRLEEALARFRATPVESGAALAPAPLEPLPPGETGDLEEDAVSLEGLVPRAGSILAMLSALGTSFLILGGAFLIRTITEAGALPTPAGIAAGFAYALAVIAAADRVARREHRMLAAFLLATAIGIGHPLVYEAVTRFHAVGPSAAAAALTLLAGACLAAAWHRGLPAIAWGACLAMAATSFALAAATSSIAPFAAALLAAGVAVEWTPGSAGWRSVRWPSALAADAMLLWLAAAPSAGAPQPSYAVVLPLLLALPVLYLGGIAKRIFATHREADPFEVVQSFVAAAIGLGGALAAIRAMGGSSLALGAAALIVAGVCYRAALGPLSREGRPHANASLAAALALGLAIFGSACVLSGQTLAWVWLGFAAAMAAAAHAGRPALRPHVAAFTWAAAFQSGLAGAALAALLVPRVPRVSEFAPPALVTIASGALFLTLAGSLHHRSPGGRIARLALAILVGIGTAGLAVAAAAPLAALRGAASTAHPGAADPGALALLRSAALAAAATAYATLSRRWALREMGGLAYAVLVLWGVKLIIEDVPAGRPLTLFAAFALYGASLLWIPKILRGVRIPDESSASTSAGPSRGTLP